MVRGAAGGFSGRCPVSTITAATSSSSALPFAEALFGDAAMLRGKRLAPGTDLPLVERKGAAIVQGAGDALGRAVRGVQDGYHALGATCVRYFPPSISRTCQRARRRPSQNG
jgi:hypothetical protein